MKVVPHVILNNALHLTGMISRSDREAGAYSGRVWIHRTLLKRGGDRNESPTLSPSAGLAFGGSRAMVALSIPRLDPDSVFGGRHLICTTSVVCVGNTPSAE
jgi:hypothetical protein